MKQQTGKKTKWLTIRMTPEDYREAELLRLQSTCATLSEYGRKVILAKPVVLRYRNQSLDDFTTIMSQVEKDLNNLVNNFNRGLQRLYTLRDVTEIQHWILHNEQDKIQLFQQIQLVITQTNKIYKLWSHE